ncbi:MAG: methyltransferase domain-containing protein [Methanosarcinales archaeon]|nr:methyltransferase domain-containing protein [ANME-2 cluster archaeon]MDW7777017.1 methyltransferase domain-containing protein [Methanosarcinales archaeon]
MSVITKYNRISYVYDLMESMVEFLKFRKWRRMVLSDIGGRVLDMGVGTGKNLNYYPGNSTVIGVDISPGMLEHAKKKAKDMDNVSLLVMDGEHLAFKDDSFDNVVTTFVLCSVPEPVNALQELRRVCKLQGTITNLEHMRSEHVFIAFLEDVFNPVFTFIMGVNINRRTVENIKKAGLKVIEERNLGLGDVFRLVRSKPKKQV